MSASELELTILQAANVGEEAGSLKHDDSQQSAQQASAENVNS